MDEEMWAELLPRVEVEENMQVEWIPVTERLPRESEYMLVTVKENDFYSYVACAYISGGKWRVDGTSYLADVTAWAPLPEPYKEG